MSDPASDTSSQKVVPISATFTVEILKVIKEAQQQHGLRHMDYQRYRAYCSRRLHRLRKTLHMVCGNQKRFQKRDITIDELVDGKLLLIPLFQCERAWSYAMQLKQEANSDPRKKFHLLNRLRKAAKVAQHLDTLSQSAKCDARTKLESQGYANLINGQLCFEGQKWQESLNYFNISKRIYEKLAAALHGDDAQTLYALKVEEIVPNIRYCNYNLGDESAKKDLMDLKLKSVTGSELAEKIDDLIFQTKEKQIVTFSEVMWMDRIALQVKNEKVKAFLLSAQEYDKQVQSTSDLDVKISIYENLLKELIDVIQAVRDELKLDPHFQLIQRGQSVPVEEKPSNSLLLFSYLTWMRLSKTIERNLVLVEQLRTVMNARPAAVAANENETNKIKSAKPQDIIRLYDIILINHKEMANLPGLQNDQQFKSENELAMLLYQTFRAYYICVFYLTNKKYREAVGFCFKVDAYIRKLHSELNSATAKTQTLKSLDVTRVRGELAWLSGELNQSRYKIQTAAILEEPDENREPAKEKLDKLPLSERMDVWFEDSSLLQSPPNVVNMALDYEPVACKPVFFDLALNYVELPSFDEKKSSSASQSQAQGQAGGQGQQQGVKGFFKGWLGLK